MENYWFTTKMMLDVYLTNTVYSLAALERFVSTDRKTVFAQANLGYKSSELIWLSRDAG